MAGFHVAGVDNRPQPRYVGECFRIADALKYVEHYGREFDFIWASPPCQAHTALRKMWNSKKHPDLIPQTRELLLKSGVPYAIENVPGAPLGFSARLCGSMFDLQTPCGAELRRHRYFECSFLVTVPQCHHGAKTLGVYGGHVRDRCRTITVTGRTPQQNVVRNRVRQTYTPDDARAAMGVDWMTLAELSQAIPPVYSEFIGRQAMQYLRMAA